MMRASETLRLIRAGHTKKLCLHLHSASIVERKQNEQFRMKMRDTIGIVNVGRFC